MTIVYSDLSDPVLNTVYVCVTHPSSRWWSLSPGCAPSSPSPMRPAGWCIPSPDSACCAPAGSTCPEAHARWPLAAAAACCSPTGFYGASSLPRTRPAAACLLLPADGHEEMCLDISQQFYLVRLFYFGGLVQFPIHNVVLPVQRHFTFFLNYISVHIKAFIL